ncbi:hypothetical protein VTN00DRAFT_7889 [Thermoascus crustaceus]|uniref:uncharacterized protein n=1 Tax=Thermoascus crustaceus TaxID=5088 RepID=UPI0037441CB2
MRPASTLTQPCPSSLIVSVWAVSALPAVAAKANGRRGHVRAGPACCRFAVRTSPLVMPAMASDASGNFVSGSQEHQFQDPASSQWAPLKPLAAPSA